MFWCRDGQRRFSLHLVSYLNQFISLHFKGDGYIVIVYRSFMSFYVVLNANVCFIVPLVLTSRHDMSHILDG